MFFYLKALPVQLVLSISAAFLLGTTLDRFNVSIFFTLSHCFVELLLFILPFMVFSFIFRALVNLQKGSARLIVLILAGVMISNATALIISFGLSKTLLPLLNITHVPGFSTELRSTIEPLFSLRLPQLMGTDQAMTLGILIGLSFNFLSPELFLKKRLTHLFTQIGDVVTFFLKFIFIPLLPIYVFGFCLKLSFDRALTHLFQHYGKVFLLSMSIVIVYLFLLYWIASGFSLRKALRLIKTMLPAGMTGFSTMSSAATMPITLSCTEKTTQDKNLTQLVIPTTSNIHMLGDDLTIVMTAMTLLVLFGHPEPSLLQFLLFTCAFCVAKLSCVGIPGASVLVVLPVLQQFLRFSPEMISVLTTIYILQDPFGTSANVMGNGAFALLIQRTFKSGGKTSSSHSQG